MKLRKWGPKKKVVVEYADQEVEFDPEVRRPKVIEASVHEAREGQSHLQENMYMKEFTMQDGMSNARNSKEAAWRQEEEVEEVGSQSLP